MDKHRQAAAGNTKTCRRARPIRGAPALLVVAGVAGFASACDNVIDLRFQVERLCVAAPKESIRGAKPLPGPLPIPGGSNTPVRMDFDRPLAQVPGAAAGLDLDVRLEDVSVRSTRDLSFIRKLSLGIEPGAAEQGLPPLHAGEFVRDVSATGPVHEIRVPSTLDVNIFKYLVGAPARLRFGLVAKVPTDDFVADIEACVYVQTQATF
jgi:hypothetical protein